MSIKEASNIIFANVENPLDLICLRFLLILISLRFLVIKAPQLGVQKRANKQEREFIFWDFSISCAFFLKHKRQIEVQCFLRSTFIKSKNCLEIRVLIKKFYTRHALLRRSCDFSAITGCRIASKHSSLNSPWKIT